MTIPHFLLTVLLPLACIIALALYIGKKLPDTPFTGPGCGGG